MQHGLLANLRQWSASWVQVKQAFQAWSHEYGWIMALGIVGLVVVVLLGVRGLGSRARAFLHTETAHPQRSPGWKGVPRVPGPSTPSGWREWCAYVGGAVMCAVVVALVMHYGSSFPPLRLSFPILTLR